MNLLNFESFNKVISEGFELKDNVFYFDAYSDKIVNTSFGKGRKMAPREMKLSLGKANAIYNRAKGATDEEYRSLLLALKGKGNHTIDRDSYHKFIKRSVIYFSSIIKNYDFDLILTMESKSPLLMDIIADLKHYLMPGQLCMNFDEADMKFKDGVKKVKDFAAIVFDKHKIGGDRVSEKTYNSQMEILKEMASNGYFEMKKIVPQFRKGLTDYLEVNHNFLSKIIGKKILLIEDYITSGESLKEASRKLHDAGAKDILALCLIKEK